MAEPAEGLSRTGLPIEQILLDELADQIDIPAVP